MSDWICLICGTINKDIEDKLRKSGTEFGSELLRQHLSRKREYELRGEIYPEYCERCRKPRP